MVKEIAAFCFGATAFILFVVIILGMAWGIHSGFVML
jgi:hypothetical protein